MAKIPLSRPNVTEEMVQAMAAAVRDERLVLGEGVFKFEEEFARYIGTDFAVSVSSGTDALTALAPVPEHQGEGSDHHSVLLRGHGQCGRARRRHPYLRRCAA